jgi:hypothetical protein
VYIFTIAKGVLLKISHKEETLVLKCKKFFAISRGTISIFNAYSEGIAF